MIKSGDGVKVLIFQSHSWFFWQPTFNLHHLTSINSDVCVCVCVCVCTHAHASAELLNCVQFFGTSWTVAHEAPLSMGILQARTLEWVAMSSSRQSSWPRNWTHISCISCISRQILSHCATWETQGTVKRDLLSNDKHTPVTSIIQEYQEI